MYHRHKDEEEIEAAVFDIKFVKIENERLACVSDTKRDVKRSSNIILLLRKGRRLRDAPRSATQNVATTL